MSDLSPVVTSSHQPVAVDRFIAAFGEFGLIGEEIADVIWLALEIQQYEQLSLSNEDSLRDEESEKADKSSPNLIDPRKPIDLSTPPDSSATLPSSDAPQQAEIHASEEQPGGGSASGSRDLAIRIPDARSLQEPLTLARALRPLFRRVPSANMVLDEAATIERIAEEQLWTPVLKPDLEPWLELALVVDESKSMLLWQRTIRELQRLLERYGIFRDVRTWGMVIEHVVDKDGKAAQQIRIRPGIGKAARNQRDRSPGELIDPQGRRLVLIATDCVAAHWHDGTVLSALKTWSQSSSTAIIQMLPEWLWSRTALALAAPVRFRALFPGLPSQQLKAKPLSTWDEIDFENGIQVPIVTLEPEIFTVWSQLVAGKGGVWAPGFVFEPELFEPDEEEENDSDHDLSAEQRVRQFYNSASPMAWKLACLLAAAPIINLPVVRIIQYKKLPKSRQVHTAEVFLGGLLSPSQPLSEITPDTNPDTIRYVFVDGVREALLESSLRSESINVFEVVSQYISDRKTTQEFIAYLKDPKQIKDGEFQSHPIAQISAQILKQLGGEYGRYAEQLEGVDEPPADEGRLPDVSLESDKTGGLLTSAWIVDSSFLAHQDNITCVCFSPDCRLIASSSDDHTIRLWGLEGNQIAVFVGHESSVRYVAFSPDGQLIASASDDNTIRLWDLQGNPIGQPFQGHEGVVTSVAFSPSGQVIASGSSDRTIRLWNLQGSPVDHPLQGHTGDVNSIAFSPNGRMIASGSSDRTIRLWTLFGKPIGQPLQHEGSVVCLAFSWNSKLIASGSADGTLRLWSSKGNPVSEPSQGHASTIYSIAFSPDGQWFVSSSRDKTIRVWSYDGTPVGEPLQGHEGGVNSVDFSPDGQMLVSCSGDKSIKLWRKQEAERTAVKHKVLEVPYFSQMDNQFSSAGSSQVTAIAMTLNYHGIQPQQNNTLADEFYQWFEEHGEDRRDNSALEKLYRAYGFDGGFSTKRTWQEITAELDAERPVVIVGYFTNSEHYVCIIGYDDEGYIVHDPAGTYSENGYIRGEKEGNTVHYSYALMERLCKSDGADGEIWSHFITPRIATIALVKKVILDELSSEQLPAEVYSQQLPTLRALRNALQGNAWIELVTNEQIDYRVRVNAAGEYAICDPTGTPFKNIRPAIKIGAQNAPVAIVKRLVHLAKYQAVESLDNSSSKLATALAVEILMEDEQPFPDPQNPTVKSEDIVCLRLSNKGSQPLKIAVLDIEPTWEVSHIAIGGIEAPFFVLNSGAMEDVLLRLTVPDDAIYEQSKETIKVFAVQRGLADFRWLTLPPLDELLEPRAAELDEALAESVTRSATRGEEPEGINPLNHLLKMIGTDLDSVSNITRSARVVVDLRQEWVTKQVQIVVKQEQSLEAELRAALAIVDEQERTARLSHLMARSPEDPSNLLHSLSTIQNEVDRVSALIALIPHLPDTLLPNVLENIRSIQDAFSRFQGLAILATLLPEAVPEALQSALEIEDESTQLRALTSVVEKLPSELLPQALQVARTINDTFARARALIALVDKLPDAAPQALEVTLEIEDEYSRARALRELVPRLPNGLLPNALEAAMAIQQETVRNDLLRDLIPLLPESLQQQINLATETPSRISLWQEGNTQIYVLCTSTPWNLPFDALVIPVGNQGGLGNLGVAFQEFPEMNSNWLSQAISETMRANKLRFIKPDQPLLVQLPSQINAQISSLTGSTSERFIICATSKSRDELSAVNTSIAYEAIVRLAVGRRFRQIIVPLIGTGMNQLSVDEVATGMLGAINNVLKSLESTSLEEITIVDRYEDKIEAIVRIARPVALRVSEL